jgi:hypothetical protein
VITPGMKLMKKSIAGSFQVVSVGKPLFTDEEKYCWKFSGSICWETSIYSILSIYFSRLLRVHDRPFDSTRL